MKGFPFRFTGLLCASVIFGVIGALLMTATPWGINFTLWFGGILAIAVWNATRPGVPADFVQRVALVAALFFTILFSWRDFVSLKIDLALVIVASLALASETALGRMMRIPFGADCVRDGVDPALPPASTPPIDQTQGSADGRDDKASRVAPRIVRAYLVIVPLLFISNWYLIENDPIIRQWIEKVTSPTRVVTQVVWSCVCAWVAIVIWCFSPNPGTRRRMKPGIVDYLVRCGAIGIGIAMLVAAAPNFLVLQLRYFFRTLHHLRYGTPWNQLSHLASSGADMLLWVVMVTFIALVYSARVMSRSRVWGKRIFKVVSGLIVLGMVLALAGALHRLSVYISTDGFTRLRLHASIFFGGMIVAFLGLYLAILHERIHTFAWAFLLSSYAIVFLVVAINTDAFIVRTNLQEKRLSRQVDTEYLGWLGADAVPAILDRIPHLKDPVTQSHLNYHVLRYSPLTTNRDWRSWTLGRHQAQKALQDFDPYKYDFKEPQNR